MSIAPPPDVAPAPATSAWTVDRSDADVVFVRSAGAAPPRPDDWRDRLRAALGSMHRVAVVGAKRLTAEGRVFSMGEFVVHPKGLHHLGHGVEGHAYRFPEEVDAIGGGVLAIDATAFEAIDGAAILGRDADGQLGPIELCLEARRAGHRVVAVPDVVVVDEFTPRPCPSARAGFRRRLGFDPLAADLDEVRREHGGGGLAWNVRLLGRELPFEKYDQRGSVHWDNYEKVDVYRQRADHLVALLRQVTPGGRVLDLGCGDGLFTHLLAVGGIDAIGLDPEETAIDQATRLVAGRTYPATAPTFRVGTGTALPFADGSMQTIAMLDVIEHLPNPVAVLRECRRVLAPAGHLVVSTPAWQLGGWSDPVYHVCEYTGDELKRQIETVTSLTITASGTIGGVYRDLVMVAGKRI
jgi:2-polyprenyl-3-methyl-5-hydroxy-6-metoxy-1,4-benzoquinol methylase